MAIERREDLHILGAAGGLLGPDYIVQIRDADLDTIDDQAMSAND